jgi:hypothetical protein
LAIPPKILREGSVWRAVSRFVALPAVTAILPKILRDGFFEREGGDPWRFRSRAAGWH